MWLRWASLGVGALAGACVLPVWGQAPAEPSRPAATISVRDLRIPEPARHLYARSRRALVEKQDAKAAVTDLRKAIQKYPDYYEAHYLLGVALLQMKQFEQAEAALRRSMALSAERFAQPMVALATLYSNTGRFAEAESLAAQALELDDSLWYAHYELGRARFALGRGQHALASARTVVREQPAYPRGRLLLAMVLAQLGEYKRALPHLDAYLRMVPDGAEHARMAQLRAEIYRVSNQVEAAVAASNP